MRAGLRHRAALLAGLGAIAFTLMAGRPAAAGDDPPPAPPADSTTTQPAGAPKIPDGAKLPPLPDHMTAPHQGVYSFAHPEDRPPSLKQILDAPIVNLSAIDSNVTNWEGVREGAVSYGMRAGFAARLFQHMVNLRARKAELERRFDFGRLVLQAPGGFFYEPGVISEMSDAVTYSANGQTAARAAERYKIISKPRVISRPRRWEDYLLFDIAPPAPIHPGVLPRKEQEEKWAGWVKDGWALGEAQADSTIEILFNEMERDLRGMIVWHTLLAEGKVTAPHFAVVDRGISADKGGTEMRVGDVEVSVRDSSHLQPNQAGWRALPYVGDTAPQANGGQQ